MAVCDYKDYKAGGCSSTSHSHVFIPKRHGAVDEAEGANFMSQDFHKVSGMTVLKRLYCDCAHGQIDHPNTQDKPSVANNCIQNQAPAIHQSS